MTISIWRYSHLTLAISSFIFILIASITGIILAFEPINNQLKPYTIQNASTVSIAKTLSALKNEYKEVVTLQIDEHNFLSATVIDKNGKSATFYIHETTGKKLGNIIEKAPIYKFATNLHRSLFLKSTGRFLVAFFSFLLFLIAVTGTLLIAKRQGGFLKFFNNTIKEDFKQFWHVVLGKYTLIPIIIITLTGVYLSLEKFSLLPKSNEQHHIDFSNLSLKKHTDIIDFEIFKNTTLNELKSIEFPFSDDDEDYFIVKLHNKELIVHQFTGEIISSKSFSWVKIVSNWSLFLHTGQGTILWAIILLLSCVAILFFMYSGFAMTLKRRQKSLLPKNKFHKDKATFIILVGSENGSTFTMATSFFNALLKAKKTVFIDHLNNYTSYKNSQHLIIFTATYGKGEPPTNAAKFIKMFQKQPPKHKIKFAVVGFGSLAYPDYCKFAIAVENTLKNNSNCIATIPMQKINNQSFIDFKLWALQWSGIVGFPLALKQTIKKLPKQHLFTVIEKSDINLDDTFIIRLQPTKKLHFVSGDLLAITPKKDTITRLYSIGKIKNDIVLSIKKHEFGVCSNLLLNLNENDILQANIQQNKEFYYPKKSTTTILIANGTGIAPFLAMLQQNPETTHLFWGGRTQKSFEIYRPYLQDVPFKNIHIAFSQEKDKMYVQQLVLKEEQLIYSTLKNGNTIMICGSINMMDGVFTSIEKIMGKPISYFKNRKQIKTDCY